MSSVSVSSGNWFSAAAVVRGGSRGSRLGVSPGSPFSCGAGLTGREDEERLLAVSGSAAAAEDRCARVEGPGSPEETEDRKPCRLREFGGE